MSDLDQLNPIPEEPKPEEPKSEGEAAPAERAIPVAEPLPVAEPVPVAEVSLSADAPAADGETAIPTTVAEEAAPASAESAAASVPDAPAPESAPVTAPRTAYRWSYADEAARHTPQKGKGIVVYAAIMTAVFLLSFGILLAVLLIDGDGSFEGLLRPGITETENDGEAVAGVEQAKRSVVVIEVRTEAGGGTGTGIIMTSDGYIATNHHVIEDATRIKVTFYDGTVLNAEAVGSSEMDDLAVIKVDAVGLPAATFAYSEDCYVGQTVYAIGTPAGPDFGWTTTKGIISYKDREVKIYDDNDGTLQKKLRLLQTDANVNPGNSGGPLVNTKGEVVGVVSMKLADGYEGIGFAIPSDGAVEILEAIVEFGNADNINSSLHHKRPMLGITGVYVDGGEYYLPNDTGVKRIPAEELGQYDKGELLHPDVSGVYIMGFAEGMDAADKMQVGDIITAANAEEVESMNHLMNIINEFYAGDTVTLTVYRNGRYIPVDIVLSAQAEATS
ncbi:MAG: trypsin-like peptidase domain-containing protein [Clostridia bacterium]|nr:trypsin-like peptidase domain-containing protein [Clostridia bacterium]